MEPNYLRAALLTMNSHARRALVATMRDRVNSDPDQEVPTTAVWFAIYCTIVDLDYEEADTLRRLESDR